MTVRSIIDIPVNDEAFQRFKSSFDEYRGALKTMPQAWADVGTATKNVSTHFDRSVVALMQQRTIRADIMRDQARSAVASDKTLQIWHGMVSASKSVALNVAGITKNFLKWSTLSGAVGGLLGAGAGLFGIDRMARDVSMLRRQSLGLGLNIGEQRAFTTDFSRVIDASGFLSGVNQTLHDVTKRVTLSALGISTAGKDTAQVGVESLMAVKRLADRTPDSQLAQIMKAYQLENLGLSLQDVERLKATPQSELSGYAAAFQRDRNALGLPKGTAKAWQDFTVQLTRAKQQIETTFITGLLPLAGPLGRLSQSFEKTVQTFLQSPTIKRWIDDVAKDFDWLSTEIGSPSFQADVTTFMTKVGEIAVGVGHFVEAVAEAGDALWKWFGGGKAGAGGGGSEAARRAFEQKANTPGTPEYKETHTGTGGWAWNWAGGFRYWSPGAKNQPNPYTHKPIAGSGPGPETAQPRESLLGKGPEWWNPATWRLGWNEPKSFMNIEAKRGLAPGLLGAVEHVESGGNPMAISRAGAIGAFQIMPDTWKQYGRGGNPFDEQQSAQTAGRFLGDLMKEFNGNLAKVLAAYNWGPQNVERDVARYGGDWEAHLPGETQDYLRKVGASLHGEPAPAPTPAETSSAPHHLAALGQMFAQMMQRQPRGLNVNINNATGANVAVSGGQLAT